MLVGLDCHHTVKLPSLSFSLNALYFVKVFYLSNRGTVDEKREEKNSPHQGR
jgi:hypothetical protein